MSKKSIMMPNDRRIIDIAMMQLGFTKVSYQKGQKRETAEEFAGKHKDKIAILNLSGHVVCCKDGYYYDTWECGYKTAYNYWAKAK